MTQYIVNGVDCRAGGSVDPLASGFETPPDSAKPRVWWHWMNGNITKEGIEQDLRWMSRVGIGGLQNFDATWDTPQIVEQRLIYMTPPWQDAFRFATALADELGLEFAIASSPGWSETGGPWVKPEDGMKKLVWSETRLPGAQRLKGTLAAPPCVAGPFQNIPMIDLMSSSEAVPGPRLYRDVAVVAYRTPPAGLQDPRPVALTTSAASEQGTTLLESTAVPSMTLPLSKSTPAWLLYDYGKPHRFRALSLARHTLFSLKSSLKWTVEASADGERFEPVAELPDDDHLPHVTVSFPAATARYWRLKVTCGPPQLRFGIEFAANAAGAQVPAMYAREVEDVKILELKLYSGARLHRFEEKAGFSVAANYYGLGSGANEPNEAVDPQDIIDLTGLPSADGALDWTPPAGDWTVLRLGYSLTGKTNHPAIPEATGLEVDKLDKKAVKAYLDTYLGQFEKTLGADRMGHRGIRAFLTDSIESAGQNWTPTMMEEFKSRRGYDLALWLPALTGLIIGDATRTERFLWDFRKTLSDLISEAHYAQIAESAHERGLLYYGESLEGYPTTALGDDLDMRQHCDIPMSAIWTSYKLAESEGITNHIIDMLGAASVAHVFGRRFVAVEALTSANEPWAFSPGSLRPVIDLAFVLGINRPVIHTSVHQPIEKKPGVTLGPAGQHFTRHETWGQMAAPWVSYLSRTSFLLQQGRHVADVAWFYGEEGSAAQLVSRVTLADFPKAYGFDLISPNMLLHHLNAHDGRLVSAGGASYRVLFLGGGSAPMTLAVLRKLKHLSEEGITIAGRPPTGSPSLADECQDDEYRRLVRELWHRGKIIDGDDPEEVLNRAGVVPDFQFAGPQAGSRVRFLHRKLANGDLYFLTNRVARAERIEARFRVTGRKPELWHADTGGSEGVSWRMEKGQTVVPLHLHAHQSLFVVFREPTDETVKQIAAPRDSALAQLEGHWQLSFESGRGAPAHVVSTVLGSWTESKEPGIKYFSGVGSYRKLFTLAAADVKSSERVLLDLGEVHELAEVRLNGQLIGTAWHAPFRLDVTETVKPGANTLEVRVANLWVNRLIGDQQPGQKPIAFTVTSTYHPEAPLRPSGLVGPVSLLRREPFV